jgi:hypothetical protein
MVPPSVYYSMMKNDNTTEQAQQDQSLMGGYYHGPSNEAGLTAREYWDARWEYEDEQERLRNDW